MKPKQFFFVLLGMIGVLIVAGGAGYYFAYTQLKTESGALAAQLGEQQTASSDIEAMSQLKIQYERDIVPILPLLDKALPRDKKQTEILAQLQTVAGETGLRIKSVSMPSPLGLPTEVSQTVKAGDVLALPISFELTGTYAQLQNFTSRVERLNRYTNITNLGISRPDKAKPIIYSISLNAYIKP